MDPVVALASKLIVALEAAPPDERDRALAIIRAAYPTPETSRGDVTGVTRSKGALRQERYRERKAGVTCDAAERNECVTGDVTPSPSLHSPSPSPSESRDLGASFSGEGDLSGSGGARVPAESGAVPVVPSNPVVLCEHFVAGVHGAGADTYAMPRNEEMRTLGGALALHCAKAPGRWLETARALGGRWVAHCEGKPKSGLKAKDWLGEGAPEAPVVRGPKLARIVQPAPVSGPLYQLGDGK